MFSLGLNGVSDADAACSASNKQVPTEASASSEAATTVNHRHKSNSTVPADTSPKNGSAGQNTDPRARWHRNLPGMFK